MFLLVVVFMAPQTYKTLHLFNTHHGHLDCHHHREYGDGINPVDDHCPVCKLTFTFYKVIDQQTFSIVSVSQPVTLVQTTTEFYPFFHAFNYQLRAPPTA